MREWGRAFAAAFTLLTRVPLPFGRGVLYTEKQIARSSVFFPLIGLLYGLALFGVYQLLSCLKAGLGITAFILLALPYLLNRFFHFDGLCDCLDAFLSDKSKDERLAILKDSHVGSFALGGTALYLLLKYILIKNLIVVPSLVPYLIVYPVLARFSMVLVSYRSKYPREKGTGMALIGKIGGVDFILSIMMSLLIMAGIYFSFPLYWSYLCLAFVACILWALVMKAYSYRKIGGLTGDVLGAVNEIAEVLIPAIVLILWKAGAGK